MYPSLSIHHWSCESHQWCTSRDHRDRSCDIARHMHDMLTTREHWGICGHLMPPSSWQVLCNTALCTDDHLVSGADPTLPPPPAPHLHWAVPQHSTSSGDTATWSKERVHLVNHCPLRKPRIFSLLESKICTIMFQFWWEPNYQTVTATVHWGRCVQPSEHAKWNSSEGDLGPGGTSWLCCLYAMVRSPGVTCPEASAWAGLLPWSDDAAATSTSGHHGES